MMKKWVTSSGYTIVRVLSGRSNVFLITNGKDHLLVDTSTKKNYKRLNKALKALNCSHISLLILTHAHFDHASNASSIQKDYQSTVAIHANDAGFLESGSNVLPQGTNAVTKLFVNSFGQKLATLVAYDAVKNDIIIKDIWPEGFNGSMLTSYTRSYPGSASLSTGNRNCGWCNVWVFIPVFPPFADDPSMMVNSWTSWFKQTAIFLHMVSKERICYANIWSIKKYPRRMPTIYIILESSHPYTTKYFIKGKHALASTVQQKSVYHEGEL